MSTRQAVLLIHGIGEQKPMETLRGFVNAVWKYHTEIHHPFATKNAGTLVWSKPDTVSDSFELRRLTTPQNTSNIRTDFFEFYWQHLMQGTTYGHVAGWVSALLLRRPGSVPRQLKTPYWLLWMMAIAALALAVYAAAATAMDRPPLSPWLSAMASVLLVPLAGGVITGTIGDAARYLHPAPANVQCRHAIRTAGITVLKALHRRQDYDRIIIVGHSLGSVIGYDILTHSWPQYNNQTPARATGPLTALEALENLARSPRATAADLHTAQRNYFAAIVAAGNTWRVTDFLTLGSPLAHAEVLLAYDRDDLRTKQNDRELPTSPPVLESSARDGVPPRFSFPADPRDDEGFRIPHHAAVFGPTRWTNIYFPNRWVVWGDLIGGPLAGVFGRGVRDRAVRTTQRGGLFSHTLYWKYALGAEAPSHIATLREALDLCDDGGIPPQSNSPAQASADDASRVQQDDAPAAAKPPLGGAGV